MTVRDVFSGALALMMLTAACSKSESKKTAAGSGSAVAVPVPADAAKAAGDAGATGSATETPEQAKARAMFNPIPEAILDGLIDTEAKSAAQGVARALVANDGLAFAAYIGDGGYLHAGVKMTKDEVKAALANQSVRTWVGYDCIDPEPSTCKFDVVINGLTLSVTGGTPQSVLLFDLTSDGTWKLSADRLN